MKAVNVLALLGLLVAGCNSDNLNYCPDVNEDDNCKQDDTRRCSSDSDCPGGKNVCNTDIEESFCVQCTASRDEACTGTTPFCGDNLSCRGCVSHAECRDSDVCLPDGSCAAPADVAYVAQGGTGTECTKAAPCGSLQTGVNKGRSIIKISGRIKEPGETQILGRTVTIVAEPNAELTRDGTGRILLVASDGGTAANVTIQGLSLSGQRGTSDEAILLQDNGVSTGLTLVRVTIIGSEGRGVETNGGTLTVSRSSFTGNLRGGIVVNDGRFVIIGNLFYNNGDDAFAVGGVAISTQGDPGNRLEFNSFYLNEAQAGVGAAIQCAAGVFTARNNIMSSNGSIAGPENVGGNCAHAYSIVRPGALPAGPGNKADDPLFQNGAMGNLKLRESSPALGAADPSSDLTGFASRDIDGDVRTSPADIGADEVP